MIYPKEKSAEISFPLGGIGTGCVGLAGNGRLIDWELFNAPGKGRDNGMSHFAIRTERAGKVVDCRILTGDLPGPYSGEWQYSGGLFRGFGWGPTQETLCGLPHFSGHCFRGEFPVAEIHLSDPDFPGESVDLTAWSPFIPGNSDDSSRPLAVFEFTLKNPTAEALDFTLIGVLGNPWREEGSRNEFHDADGLRQLILSRGGDPAAFEYGELALTTDAANCSFQEYWYRGRWNDGLEVYWNDLMRGGRFRNRRYDSAPGMKSDHGLLAAHFRLEPGESHCVRFLLSWHVPNRRNDWDPAADARAAENGLVNRWRNYYASLQTSAADGARRAFARFDELREATMLFRRTLHGSTLPEAALDAVSSNLAVLRSPTVLRLEDGTFYGWEGVGCAAGSCEGSCTHVWNYAQAAAFLFPDLERSLREAHARYSIDAPGGAHFRLKLPLGVRQTQADFRPCVDGQFGEVMKIYREWKISGDTGWLCRMWPAVREMIEYAWSPDNFDRWDPGRTGVISGRQHHTLDMELWGPNAWLTGIYLGALKAASRMADAAGDPDFGAECGRLFDRGAAWVAEHLFNGKFFFQEIDLGDRSLLEWGRNGKGEPDAGHYWDSEHNQIKYQIGRGGCEIDMTLGDHWAKLYGLGGVFDPGQVKKHLISLFRCNYHSSQRRIVNVWRNYALNDEGGIQICSWPDPRTRPVITVPYATECMNGFEYAAAAQMIDCGMVREGMTIVEAVRRRYDGVRRNPYNEFECGSNYARSMASYALLPVFSGFRFDLVAGEIGFQPLAEGEFRCFWSVEGAWGEFHSDPERNLVRLKVLHGALRLARFGCGAGFTPVSAGAGERKIAFAAADAMIVFPEALTLAAGEELLLSGPRAVAER